MISRITNHPALAMIERTFGTTKIQQREADVYLDATAMCKATGKKWNDYYRLDATKAFLATFSDEKAGNPAFYPIEVTQGRAGGTWVHPDLAVDLSQWANPTLGLP